VAGVVAEVAGSGAGAELAGAAGVVAEVTGVEVTEVAACACRENTSKTTRIPAATIATCTARRAMRRKIGCGMSNSRTAGTNRTRFGLSIISGPKHAGRLLFQVFSASVTRNRIFVIRHQPTYRPVAAEQRGDRTRIRAAATGLTASAGQDALADCGCGRPRWSSRRPTLAQPPASRRPCLSNIYIQAGHAWMSTGGQENSTAPMTSRAPFLAPKKSGEPVSPVEPASSGRWALGQPQRRLHECGVRFMPRKGHPPPPSVLDGPGLL
jgi:hypothetical protein